MKNRTKPHFQKVLRVYLGEKEYEKVVEAARQSMCRSLSEYGRKIMLNKPITVQYRNRSADEAVEAIIEILALLKKYLGDPSLREADKEWLRVQVTKIEESCVKIFSLCLPK